MLSTLTTAGQIRLKGPGWQKNTIQNKTKKTFDAIVLGFRQKVALREQRLNVYDVHGNCLYKVVIKELCMSRRFNSSMEINIILKNVF